MANELNFAYSPGGETIVAQVFDEGWTQQGGNVTLTEFATALYRGNMPGAIPLGEYVVIFRTVSATGTIVGSGLILWDSTVEITSQEQWSALLDVYRKEGLDSANPTTYRPTKIFSGAEGAPALELVLTGDCETEIVSTRTP